MGTVARFVELIEPFLEDEGYVDMVAARKACATSYAYLLNKARQIERLRVGKQRASVAMTEMAVFFYDSPLVEVADILAEDPEFYIRGLAKFHLYSNSECACECDRECRLFVALFMRLNRADKKERKGLGCFANYANRVQHSRAMRCVSAYLFAAMPANYKGLQ